MQRLDAGLLDAQITPRACSDHRFPQGQLDKLSIGPDSQLHWMRATLASWNRPGGLTFKKKHL